MRHTAWSGLWALGFGMFVAACSGEKPRPATPPTQTDKDAGEISGSEPYDGSVPLPRKDAGPIMIPPGDPEEGLIGECAVDSNKIYTVAQRSEPFRSTPLAVDSVNSRFIIPFANTGDCLDAVHMATLAGEATGGEPTDTTPIKPCALVRDAAATALSDRWLIASIDNRQGAYDLWLTPYEAESGAVADAQRLTMSSAVETSVALATLQSGDAALLAYADEDDAAGQTLSVRPLDNLGKPTADAVKLDESKDLFFSNVVLKPLGKGAAIAYVRSSFDFKTSDIVFVMLDAQGKSVREPWVLTRLAGPSPSVDLAVDNESGGIVYARAEATTGRQIWFQLIDTDGQAALLRDGKSRSPAQRIVNSPQRGIDVSVAKLRATFVVGYRSLPLTADARAALRAYFLDRNGLVVGSSDVSYTSSGGGRTNVQSSSDGRVVLAWNELNATGSALKVVRVPCVGN
jgi:hypothetical protein